MRLRAAAVGLLAAGLSLIVAGDVWRARAASSDASRAHALAATAGVLDDRGLARLARGLGAGGLALEARFDPARHADLWDRLPAWAQLDLAHPPALPVRDVTQDDAAVINAALPPDLAFLAPAKPFFLHASGPERERAVLCMTQAVYFEAGFEPLEGEQAVAQIILNRVRHPAFPKSVCGVVYQGSSTPLYCQFTFTCDGSLLRTPVPAAWERAHSVAEAALNGFVARSVGSSTFYHADYVFPRWGLTMVKVVQLGAHIFYRFPGPAGEPQALNGRYGGDELAVSITGPPLEAIEAARAALGHGVYASAIAPLGPSLIPPPGVAETAPVATQAVASAAPPLTAAAAAPPAPARPGQVIAGRRIPTRDEIARINAQLSPPGAPGPAPSAAADDGPIATAHAD